MGSHRIVLPATVEVVFGSWFVSTASKQIAGGLTAIKEVREIRPKVRHIRPPAVHDARAFFSRSWTALVQ
jgi:hypothetical protein